MIGAVRIGTGYKPSFDITNPAFREWVKLSVPLMLGVSLVTADDWILRHYASSVVGGISRLNFAKRLFAVPIAVLGQATGQASLPFFARLFNEKKLKEFAETVNDSVYRVSAASFLGTALDGRRRPSPNRPCLPSRQVHLRRLANHGRLLLLVFAVARIVEQRRDCMRAPFYAAGDTLTPMVAVSVITACSLPIYSLLFNRFGA